MEDLEVLGRTGELVNEEHERLRQLEVNLNRRWDPAAAPGAQRSWLRSGRGYCKGRVDARGLLWQRRRRRLNKLGFKAAALDGGFDAWKARYPVEPPEVERAEAR